MTNEFEHLITRECYVLVNEEGKFVNRISNYETEVIYDSDEITDNAIFCDLTLAQNSLREMTSLEGDYFGFELHCKPPIRVLKATIKITLADIE